MNNETTHPHCSQCVRKADLPPDTPWLKGLDDSAAPPFAEQLRNAPGGVLITMYHRDSPTDGFEWVHVVRADRANAR